jgi:DnaJ family protein B protein 11
VVLAKQSFYDLLHIHAQADEATIKRSYRKLALQLHPDKVQGSEDEKRKAAEKFAEVSHAYEVLMDPKKRQMYDRYGEEGLKSFGEGGGGGNPNDIFSQFFGGGYPFGGGFPFGGGAQEEEVIVKGENVHVGLDVALEDLYGGKEVRVVRDKHVLKPAPGTRQCNCKQKLVTRQIGPGMFQQATVQECETCDNVQLVRETDTLMVHIEPGMKDGQEIVFFEEGEPAVDGEHGDLVFHVQLTRHDVFERRGDDLLMTLGVTLTEALVGFEKTVRHLDGHDVILKKDGITRPGEVMVVQGEGMPVYEGSGGAAGQLVVTVMVRFPESSLGKKEQSELEDVLKKVEAWGDVRGVHDGRRAYTDEVHKERSEHIKPNHDEL